MLARKSLFVVISQFFTRFFGWIGLIVLAKLWGGFAPDALGVIGFAMAFIGLFNVIADLGFGQAHIKRVSEGRDLGTCLGTFAAIKASLTLAMAATVILALYVLENVINKDFTDATTKSVIIIFLLYYILLNIQNIPTYTFNGRAEIAKMQITGMFENIVKVPLMILVALAGVSLVGLASPIKWPNFLQTFQNYLASHTFGALASTYVFGIFATVIIGFWFLRKYPLKKPNLELGKSYFYFALPMLLISVISTISTNIDKLMIGYFWTSTEVGYYFSLQQILQIILIISFSFNTVLFPAYSRYHAQKDFEKINRTTILAERYISMVIMPVGILIIIFVNPVITIMLNSAFLPAASTLITLTIYAIVTSFMAPYYSLVGGLNRPGVSAKIGFVICLTNIVLNYLFIPKEGLLSSFGINGPTGAAVATFLSTFVGFVLLKIVAKRLTGIKLTQIHTLLHIVAGLIMAFILLFINSSFPLIRWYHLIGFGGLGLVIYLGILFIFKEFRKEDVIFFMDIINPKKMISYIKSELKE